MIGNHFRVRVVPGTTPPLRGGNRDPGLGTRGLRVSFESLVPPSANVIGMEVPDTEKAAREAGLCPRLEAAGLLGLSVKRVDQLRAAGVLESRRHPVTGRVWVTLASVRTERTRREAAP